MMKQERSCVKYFNGFSLEAEEDIFSEYCIQSDLSVVGFSYGAQKALEYAYQSDHRIDRLILLSPAFFQNQKQSFVRTQLRYFKSAQESYVKQFLENVSYPSIVDLTAYLSIGTSAELEALLTYKWDKEKIQKILNRGTTIEVFLGSEDKIINAKDAFEFFSPLATTYFIKGVGHLLCD